MIPQPYGWIVIAWVVAVLAFSIVMFWRIEREVRTWPQPNWTTPTTRRHALAVVVLPLLAYGFGLAAMMRVASVGDDLASWEPVRSPWFATMLGISVAVSWAMLGLAFARARRAPHDSFKLRPPRFGGRRASDAALLTQSLLAASQTFRVQGIAAEVIGVPEAIVHILRLGLMLGFVAVFVIAQVRIFV